MAIKNPKKYLKRKDITYRVIFDTAVKQPALVSYIDQHDYRKAKKIRKNISENIMSTNQFFGLILDYMFTNNIWIIDQWPKKYDLEVISYLNNPLDDLIIAEGSIRLYQDKQATYMLFKSTNLFNYDRLLSIYKHIQFWFINTRIKAYKMEKNRIRYVLFEIPHSYLNRWSAKAYIDDGYPLIRYDYYFDNLPARKKQIIMKKRHELITLLA